MGSEDTKKDQPKFLVLLLFIGAAVLAVSYFDSSDTAKVKENKPAVAPKQVAESSVNSHLMYTNDKIELQRRALELENARTLNKAFKRNSEQSAYVNPNKLDLSAEDHSTAIAEVLGRGEKKQEIQSPEEIVQQEIYMAEQAAEYNEAYREEYARQFVENARRGGYKVILSSDLSRVISVTPIRRPSKESFNLDSNGFDPVR